MTKIKHEVTPAVKEIHTFTAELTALEVQELIKAEMRKRLKEMGKSSDAMDLSDDFKVIAELNRRYTEIDHPLYNTEIDHPLYNPKIEVRWTEQVD